MSNVTVTAALTQNELSTDTGKILIVSVAASVVDSRPYLSSKSVNVTVNWGDGSPVSTSGIVQSPWTGSFSHTYLPGEFSLSVSAVNYETPQNSDLKTFDISLNQPGGRFIPPTQSGFAPVIFGPILPRDSGYPNTSEWKFQSSQDSVLLESSARLLLLTAVGERLMNLTYGTRIGQMIFNQMDQTTSADVTAEIRRAFAANEQRLEVAGVIVARDLVNSKQVNVTVTLNSTLDNSKLVVTTSLIQA